MANQPLYAYVDTSHNTGAQLLSDMRPLVDRVRRAHERPRRHDRDVRQAHARDEELLGGPGARGPLEKLSHGADEPPPSDLGTKPVTVDFDAYDVNAAPMMDFVHASNT